MFEVCKRCLMPNTRPQTPFEEGVCQACYNYDTRTNVNWTGRLDHLHTICEQHYRDGKWDCVLPVSGGKDSHAMVHWLKVKMGLNPLLVTVGDIFTKTQAGKHNFDNLSNTFGCDHVLFKLNPHFFRWATRECFERYLDPLRLVEQVLHTFPFRVAAKFGINLIFFGESDFIYGGSRTEEASALPALKRELKHYDAAFWRKLGASETHLGPLDSFDHLNAEAYWLSYFVPWSSLSNLNIAKQYGFQTLKGEWERDGSIDNFEQIDSIGYMAHIWMKYPKFGFQRVSDIASRRIRDGAMSKEEAREAIILQDRYLDHRARRDFCQALYYTSKEFWTIVNRFWNPAIFEANGEVMKVDRFGGMEWKAG